MVTPAIDRAPSAAATAACGQAAGREAPAQAVRLDQLPTEVLQHILAAMPGADVSALARLATVSRAFNQALQGSSCVWRDICLQHGTCQLNHTAVLGLVRWLKAAGPAGQSQQLPRCAQVSSLALHGRPRCPGFEQVVSLLAPRLERAAFYEDPNDGVEQAELDQLVGLGSSRLVSLELAFVVPDIQLHDLSSLAGLRHLSLHFDSGDAEPFPFALCDLNQLTALDLGYPCLGQLPDALSRLTALRRLSVSACPLADEGMEWAEDEAFAVRVEPGLGQLRSLEFLRLQRCYAMPEEWPSLSGLTALSALVFDLCSFLGNELPAGCCAAPALHALSCTHVRLKGLRHLQPAAHASLETLRLLDCRLKELPEVVCQLRGLTRLDLRFNPLVALPRAISRLERLRCLKLAGSSPIPVSEDDFAKPGSVFLPLELAELSQLRVVDLCNTAFTLEAGLALRLAAMPRLERVRLAGALSGARELAVLVAALAAQGGVDRLLEW